MKNNQVATKAWTKPELTALGTLRDVAAKLNTQQDGASGNFTFGNAS